MAALAYTTAYGALMWRNNGTFRLINYTYFMIPKDSAFILSKSRFNLYIQTQLRYLRDGQMDRQIGGFSAL